MPVENNILLYEKCRHCHLFIEPDDFQNESGVWVESFIHLDRDDEEDQKIILSHQPEPSGMKANLKVWQMYGPEKMRERFFNVPEGGF